MINDHLTNLPLLAINTIADRMYRSTLPMRMETAVDQFVFNRLQNSIQEVQLYSGLLVERQAAQKGQDDG